VRLPESFHSDCRDACAASPSGLDDLFMREVLLDDAEEIARQIASGVCLHIADHTAILDSVSAPPRACPAEPRCDKPAAVATPEAEAQPTEKKAANPADGSLQGIERGWLLSKAMAFL